jgi:hypothetical protein
MSRSRRKPETALVLISEAALPVPGSPRSEPAGALGTARPSSRPGLWDKNGLGVAGVPRGCVPVSSISLE